VVGFVLYFVDSPNRCIYFSGDTVWYEGLAEIATRFQIEVAILNLGAACVAEVGPFHLTMTSVEAINAARLFSRATVIPLHFEGWAHFSEGQREICQTFAAAGLSDRLLWPESGLATQIDRASNSAWS
jgi:L-ascorbate metabolism protein UlaG (beta-lactamase superfamily)